MGLIFLGASRQQKDAGNIASTTDAPISLRGEEPLVGGLTRLLNKEATRSGF